MKLAFDQAGSRTDGVGHPARVVGVEALAPVGIDRDARRNLEVGADLGGQQIGVDPAARAPLVAQEIDIFTKIPNENASALDCAANEMALSPLAIRLLALAPDKTAVLQAFGRHFFPSHWSGSLAQTLAPHEELLEKLVVDPDPVVAAWAQKSLEVMRQRIEQDQRMHARDEQTFE